MPRPTCRRCRFYADPAEPDAVCCAVPPQAVVGGWRPATGDHEHGPEPIIVTVRPVVGADEPACRLFELADEPEPTATAGTQQAAPVTAGAGIYPCATPGCGWPVTEAGAHCEGCQDDQDETAANEPIP